MRNVSSFVETVTVSDEQIREQICYCSKRGWALVIEHTTDLAPDNHFWERWGLPMLDSDDPDLVLFEIDACRKALPHHHIRVNACEAAKGRALVRHTLLVQAPGVSRD
jgi:ribulose-bisphosphate carboxylase small chain